MPRMAKTAISAAAFFVIYALLDLLLNGMLRIGQALFIAALYFVFSLALGVIVNKVRSKKNEL